MGFLGYGDSSKCGCEIQMKKVFFPICILLQFLKISNKIKMIVYGGSRYLAVAWKYKRGKGKNSL